MRKLVVVARHPGGPSPRTRDLLLRAPGTGATTGLAAYVAHPALDEGPADVVGAVMAWIDGDVDPDELAAAFLGDLAAEAYLVDERRQWDYERDWPDGAASPGVKRISFLRRVPGLTRQEFGDHWRDVHARLARRHHPGLWRYVQNVVIEPLGAGAPEVDGIAELSFRTVGDMHDRMYDSPEGREIIATDVRHFIDLGRGWRILTEEHVLLS